MRPGREQQVPHRYLVLPPINGGLHCDAAARAGLELRAQVLPPINGGLHCDGYMAASFPLGRQACSRL